MRTFLLAALFAALALPAQAQFAVGGQLGDPTGLSLKAGAGPGALLLAIGWDLDGFDQVSAEGHYVLSQRRVQGADANLGLFYGPGLFLRASDGPGDGDVDFGLSLGIGLEAALTQDIEAYGLVSPRIQLIEETDFGVGGGVGLRLRP